MGVRVFFWKWVMGLIFLEWRFDFDFGKRVGVGIYILILLFLSRFDPDLE